MTGARLNSGTMTAICWGLAYLVLAGMIGLELGWGKHGRQPLPAQKAMLAVRADYPAQPEFALLPLRQGFAETTVRPIFTPSRRSSASSAQAISAMQKGQFTFLGSLIFQNKRIAMLRETATGKTVQVGQGKEIRGIMVANVYPEKVVLTQGGDTEELVLKIQPASKLPVTPSVVPGQTRQPGQAGQPGQAAPQAIAPPNITPNASIPADGGGEVQSLINQRRGARGLPPI